MRCTLGQKVNAQNSSRDSALRQGGQSDDLHHLRQVTGTACNGQTLWGWESRSMISIFLEEGLIDTLWSF